MAISLSTFAPNTQAVSSEVNTNFTNLKTAAQNASYRAFTWGIVGTLATGNEQGMKWIVPQNLTCSKLWYKTGSGTATIRIQKNGTDIKSSASVTSTVGSTTSFDSTTVSAGDVLTIDITATSSGVDLFVTLEMMVTDNV